MLIVPRKTLFVHRYQREALCDKGIPLQNYEHYIATPDGCIDVKKLGVTVLVNSGCLYVPAGYIVHLVFRGALDRKTKNLDIELASCLLAPLPFKKKLELLSENVKPALLSWHKSSTKDKQTPPCGWSARSSLLHCSLSVE